MAVNSLKQKTDEELMEIYRAGNALAFEILFERHSGRVLGFLNKRLGSRKETQDLVQEVFFKLHRSKELYKNTLSFKPWLFTITRSVLLDFVKKKSLEDPTEVSVFDSMASQEPAMDTNALSEMSTEALSSLPENQREAISLRVLEEESYEEIGDRLLVSPENARQLVSRGLKKLKMVLAPKKD